MSAVIPVVIIGHVRNTATNRILITAFAGALFVSLCLRSWQLSRRLRSRRRWDDPE